MSTRKFRRYDIWTSITLCVFVFYLFALVYPLFNLLIKSFISASTGKFSLEYFQKFFGKKYYYGVLFNSLKITTCVTILCVIIGTILAYLMTKYEIKGKRLLQVLILISSMNPPSIGAYSWIVLLGRNGVVTNGLKNAFNIKIPSIYGFNGILLVLTLELVPLIYMYVSGALKNIDESLLEAAESMNCTGVKKLIKVIIPLILPTILAGALLVFMRALADFGTPMLIGEGYKTIPVLIFNEFINEVGTDDSFAAAISVVVIVLATTIFLIQKYITNKKSFTMNSLHPIQAKKLSGIKGVLIHIFIYLFVFVALIPQLTVIFTSFLNTAGSGLIFTKGFSLNSYRTAFDRAQGAIKNTFFIAIVAIAIIVLLAILIAYVTVRRQNAGTNLLDTVTMLPYIVPGSILGIALLVCFNKEPFILSGTYAILIMAFVLRRLPYTIRSSSAIMHQISISVEEASISLGASNLKTFFKVTLPMMLPGVLSGAILSWITIISELSTSIILYTARTKTMTIAVYTEVIRGNYGVAAALGTILTVTTVISLLIFFKVTGEKDITM